MDGRARSLIWDSSSEPKHCELSKNDGRKWLQSSLHRSAFACWAVFYWIMRRPLLEIRAGCAAINRSISECRIRVQRPIFNADSCLSAILRYTVGMLLPVNSAANFILRRGSVTRLSSIYGPPPNNHAFPQIVRPCEPVRVVVISSKINWLNIW